MMLFFGFLTTRLTKRLKLPNVTAYILAGILLGPYAFDLVPSYVVSGMSFLSDIALAFIAFGAGEFFKLATLRKNGVRILLITLSELFLASSFVFAASYWLFALPLSFSLLLASLASATAPASTVMTIRQTGAKGDFVDTLLEVMALDNVISLLAYSLALALAGALLGGSSFSAGMLLQPILRNGLCILLGGAFGLLLRLLIPEKRSGDNRLIIVVALLFLFCGICAIIDVSPLLGCMMIGAVYTNIGGDDKLFLQISYFSPPILLLFFVRSGISFRLDSLFATGGGYIASPLIAISLAYFFFRTFGKLSGSYLGCLLARKEPRVRRYLGFAEIPQASVAIGLAALGSRALGGEAGAALETVVLAAGVLYEIVGPILAKMALYYSGSYTAMPKGPPSVAEGEDETECIQETRDEQPKKPAEQEAEDAYTEAAEEQLTP